MSNLVVGTECAIAVAFNKTHLCCPFNVRSVPCCGCVNRNVGVAGSLESGNVYACKSAEDCNEHSARHGSIGTELCGCSTLEEVVFVNELNCAVVGVSCGNVCEGVVPVLCGVGLLERYCNLLRLCYGLECVCNNAGGGLCVILFGYSLCVKLNGIKLVVGGRSDCELNVASLTYLYGIVLTSGGSCCYLTVCVDVESDCVDAGDILVVLEYDLVALCESDFNFLVNVSELSGSGRGVCYSESVVPVCLDDINRIGVEVELVTCEVDGNVVAGLEV